MKRLELGAVRICRRCGRGRATLTTDDGDTISIPLDPARARVLGRSDGTGDVPWLAGLMLQGLARDGLDPQEIVLDLQDGVLRALVSCRRGEEPEMFACTPQEGVELANRSGVSLYATDEALAHAASAGASPGETLH